MVGFMGLTVVTTCACALLLTDHTLPNSRLRWANTAFAFLRSHEAPIHVRVGRGIRRIAARLLRQQTDDADYGHEIATKKINQFARGDVNMNVVAIWLIVLPCVINLFGGLPGSMKYADEEAALDESVSVNKLRWEYTSYYFGFASVLCLVWFMIPVTRHSILLAAMGWSPTHALRMHIWAGYFSFVFMIIHGVILVPVWFIYYDYPVWKQIIPAPECYTTVWTEEMLAAMEAPCDHVFYNWTGILAAIPFIILWAASFNWVRRRYYRVFYITHVVCGTLTILFTILHMQFFALYFIPSITYYMASTAPTLIQALASRFRGGVAIRKVVAVENSGGCVEVHMESHERARAELDKEPCLFVKLCVPKISLVWHPFDVYQQSNDPATVRFLFRPVGPFTKQLAERLTSPERPVTLVDGFYKGADRSEQALQHDCVTIVAGGVAITPYLTMIPSLVRRIGRSADGATTKTKTISIHWVCREAGLCSFVVDTYLRRILNEAKRTHGDALTVECFVYLTGTGKKVGGPDESATTLENSSRFLSTPLTNHSDTSPNQSETTSDGDPEAPASEENGTGSEEEGKSVRFDREGSEEGASAARDEITVGGGHALELARLMPRRYSNPIWNFPAFVAISAPTWFGFWFIFKYYMYPYDSYYDLSLETLITMYFILISFGWGIGIEGVVLACRKVWPQPKMDAFDVVHHQQATTAKEAMLEADLDSGEVVKMAPNGGAEVTIVLRQGRPTADQILASARVSEAPGIFMCGPAPLLGLVKKETSKENSYLGLTRYCLYEEQSEM